MGRKANDALFLRLKESGMNVVNVGDSKEPAKILKSVSAAYDAAVAL